MKSCDLSADIFYLLSDGKKHTYQEIADKVECSYSSVRRHIQALTYKNINIESFKGGIDRGGVQMIPEQKVSVEKLSSDDLQLIINTLSSLQDGNVKIKSFLHKLSTQKELKENYYGKERDCN